MQDIASSEENRHERRRLRAVSKWPSWGLWGSGERGGVWAELRYITIDCRFVWPVFHTSERWCSQQPQSNLIATSLPSLQAFMDVISRQEVALRLKFLGSSSWQPMSTFRRATNLHPPTAMNLCGCYFMKIKCCPSRVPPRNVLLGADCPPIPPPPTCYASVEEMMSSSRLRNRRNFSSYSSSSQWADKDKTSSSALSEAQM
ncbi:hypothetical protein E2C01_035833 [Portunus trituberculatus]|uniref:Uncharacterized protein n=1 Tax=Portunus trituberculatus TaxID=210409 RepID=A0A5B7F9I5_PORTR|nr:hypothetical protein [Portunus trituberculatus]